MNELVSIFEGKSIADCFKKSGLDHFIEKIEEEARSIVADVNTVAGRKTIASAANKVARSKTYLDGLGKELVSGIKAQVKTIDSERKNMRDRLDALKEKVRQPLTEYEEKEKKKEEKKKLIFSKLNDLTFFSGTSYEILEKHKEVEGFNPCGLFNDDITEYKRLRDNTLNILKLKYNEALTEEVEEKKAKIEEEARIKSERDEEIKRVKEQARKEAIEEEKLRAEQEAMGKKIEEENKRIRLEYEYKAKIEEMKRRDAEEKAKTERIEHEKALALKRIAEQAARNEASQKAERERAEKEKELAVKRAMQEALQRQAEEEAEAKAEEERKANDEKHKQMVRQSLIDDIMAIGFDYKQSFLLIEAVEQGRVLRLKIIQ